MSRLEDLEQRVAALEERLQVEAGLRASGDRDLADIAASLRAQELTIQALAITQSQHNTKLDQITDVVTRHEASLAAAHGKLDVIVTLLGRLSDER